MLIHGRFVLVFVSLCLLSSCGSIKRGYLFYTDQGAKQADSALDMGYVAMSAYKPVPWHHVSESYKPKFRVNSAEDLLKVVAPRTGLQYTSTKDSAGFSAGIEYSGGQIGNSSKSTDSSASSSSSSTENAETKTTNTETSGQSTESSNSLSKKTPTPQDRNVDPKQSDFSYTPDFDSEMDPTTRYRAATSLYQRIKSLNNYLDSAYHDKETSAYLMRLQLTVSPFTKSQPFNLISRISLRGKNESNSEEEGTISQIERRLNDVEKQIKILAKTTNNSKQSSSEILKELTDLNSKLSALETKVGAQNRLTEDKLSTLDADSKELKSFLNNRLISIKENIQSLRLRMDLPGTKPSSQDEPVFDAALNYNQDMQCKSSDWKKRNPEYEIFPLLHAENLERISTTQIYQVLRDVSLSLKGSGGQVAGSLGYKRAIEQLQALVGDRLNNLVSFMQLDKDDLTIRLNAAYDPASGKYALREKTFEVAFVLVVKNEFFKPEATGGCSLDASLQLSNVYRHAQTGKPLPTISRSDIKEWSKRYQASRNYASSDFSGYGGYEDNCTRSEFSKYVEWYLTEDRLLSGDSKKCFIHDKALYWELKRAQNQVAFSMPMTLEATLPEFPNILEVGTFSDNTKGSTVKIAMPSRHSPQDISSYLDWPASGMRLRANKVTYEDRVLVSHFPSLKALGLSPTNPNGKLDDIKFKLEIDDFAQTYTLREDKVASKKPVGPISSFSLSKLETGFGVGELDLNGTPIKNSHVRLIVKTKKLEPTISKFRFELTGTTLGKVYGVNEDNNLVKLSNAKYNFGNNSVTFDKGQNLAFEIYTTNEDVPDKNVEVKVVGVKVVDGVATDVKAQSASIVFEKE